MEKINPVKSPNDPKNYVAFQLENGLKLLIVSDLECDKAAASVSVGAGSMNDPENLPGLAHLCEHLLSIEVNDKPVGHKPFNAFIAEHGGMFNAFTARDQTNFHFDVDPSVFPDALQRFFKFFTSMPNLSEKDIEREILIVDAEHMSKANKDAWRKMAVEACTAKEGHPFQKFSTGNKSTLSEVPKHNGISVLNAARDFRLKYYVSNIMAVVIYAKESLKSLTDLCVPILSQIKDNKQISLPIWEELPYGHDELRKRIDIVSVSDIRDFFLVFPMANMRPFYKTFPHGYLTRAIGNRGPGSLYSYLSDMQWVETSYMNASIPARGFGELSVGFQLTKSGMDHLDEIILLSFQYIKMLRYMGPQEIFWKEMQEVMYLKFLHQDKEIPVDFSQRMSNLMHVYPLEDILGVGAIITKYEPSLIQQYMDYLDPENCRVVTLCKANEDKNKNFLKDHWYAAKYTLTNFSEEQIQKWKFCEVPEFFSFPEENKFIPTNFDLKNKQNHKTANKRLSWSPVLLSNTSLCKAWYLSDNEFQLAKGVIRIEISSPFSTIDPISYNLNQLWFLTLKSMMADEFYSATVAGAYHGIKPTLSGVEITVSGFSDKLLILMEEILSSVTKSVSMSDAFKSHYQTAKGRYATGLTNLKNLPPSSITNHYLSLLLREKRFSYEELISAMEDASEENLILYMKSFFFWSYFEWMIYGNFTKMEAEDFITKCTINLTKQFNTRAMLPSQNVRCREVSLSPGVQFVFKNNLLPSGNSCAVLIQIGVLDMKESLITEIIDQIIYEPLFTQLRNKEQIGYIVRSSVRKSNGCQGLLIFLQGDKDPSLMSERVFEVLNVIEDQLTAMSPAEFNQQKSAVRIRKSEYPKSMLMLFNKLWNNEVLSRRYDFGRIEKELTMLEEITKEEVLTFFKKHVSKSSSNRKVLQIHLHKKAEISDNQTNLSKVITGGEDPTKAIVNAIHRNDHLIFISDITAWKMTMNLYPLNVASIN